MEFISTTRIKSSLYTRGYKRKWAIGVISDAQVIAANGVIDDLMLATSEGWELCTGAVSRCVADGVISA